MHAKKYLIKWQKSKRIYKNIYLADKLSLKKMKTLFKKYQSNKCMCETDQRQQNIYIYFFLSI